MICADRQENEELADCLDLIFEMLLQSSLPPHERILWAIDMELRAAGRTAEAEQWVRAGLAAGTDSLAADSLRQVIRELRAEAGDWPAVAALQAGVKADDGRWIETSGARWWEFGAIIEAFDEELDSWDGKRRRVITCQALERVKNA